MFQRVLVANRGEIAVRIIRAVHELGAEAVAVYSTADRDSLHVRLADRAVCIGPPSAAESYLRVANVIAAAETTGCEAVHPGYGFLSENPAFVRACEDNDLVFVGPGADVMERMGDKARAKAEMKAANVPLVPGTEGGATLAEVRVAAEELGFPVLLKATAGGGGKGMRLVHDPEALEAAYSTARAEAEAAFSDGSLYLEKALVPARHVEIQVLCDKDGGVLTLGERECSIQRRHQKLIEESPSPALDADTREEMEAAAERACRTIGYENAGTFEFLLGADGTFHFIELNARLQVEHPVSELVTGVDVVREQLRVAAGERLSLTGRAPRRGHALEIRLNAEDPSRDFAPAPGTITRFRPPLGPGVRIDTHLEEGSAISPYYDSLIAKLIVWAEDRPAAIARGIRALEEIGLDGVPTTRGLALEILRSAEFASGEYSTSFLAEMEGRLPALTAEAVRSDSEPRRPRREERARRDQDRGRRAGRARDQRRGAGRRRPRPPARGAVSTSPSRTGRSASSSSWRPATAPSCRSSPERCRRASPMRSELDGAHGRTRRRRDRGARPVSTGRRQARRTALFLLYQWDLTGQPLTALYEGQPDAFALDLAEAVSGRAEELDRRITASAEGWTADRLGTLERNILRIGIHELEEESVPPEVAMNEAVVLAKRYASEDAARLVNGILARVAREEVA